MTKRNRIAIYARKSVDKDTNSVSIEMQIEACRKKAAEYDPKAIVDEYSDTGYSGKNVKRPDFQKMLELVKLKKYDAVIIYKIDRISRSTVDFVGIYEELKKSETKIIAVEDPLDTTTPLGEGMMMILAVFAELERNAISTRITSAFSASAKNDGRYLGGSAPVGYKRHRNELNHPSLIIDQPKADMVIDLYNKYAYDINCSLYELTAYLAERWGVEKYAGAIRTILTNEKYVKADNKIYKYWQSQGVQILRPQSEWTGARACYTINTLVHHRDGRTTPRPKAQWQVALANWEGFVDSDTWLIVQDRLAKNKMIPTGTIVNKRKWRELTGLIKCGECGSSIRIVGDYRNISCARKWKGKGLDTCTQRFTKLRPETVHANVAEKIQKYLDNDDLRNSKNLIEKSYESQIQVMQDNISRLAKTIADNPSPALMAELAKREKQLQDMQYKVVQNYNSNDDLVRARIQKFAKDGKIIYADLDDEQKAELLKILLKEIKLYRDGTVVFAWADGISKDPDDAMALARLDYEKSESERIEKEKAKMKIMQLAKDAGIDVNIDEINNNTYNPDDDPDIIWEEVDK